MDVLRVELGFRLDRARYRAREPYEILRETTISAPAKPALPAPTLQGPSRRLLRDHRTWHHLGHRGARRSADLRDDGVHRHPQPAHPVGGTPDVAGNSLQGAQVAAVTALSAGFMTVLFGLVARLPFAFAAGLGINSFLAVSVVQVVTWPEAMGLVVINGLIIVLLAATGLRRLIFNAVPAQLKTAITVGIGLFIAFIGFVDSGFVRSTNLSSPPVQLGDGRLDRDRADIDLRARPGDHGRADGAQGQGRAADRDRRGDRRRRSSSRRSSTSAPRSAARTRRAGISRCRSSRPRSSRSPTSALVGQVDLFGSFGRIGALAAVMLIFTLVFTNFFDAMGSMTGLARSAGLAAEDGTFPRLQSALIVEGVGAVVGGGTSSSSNTVFVESASGIGEGAKTGLRERRHRRALPARHVLHAADAGRSARGGGRGPGRGRFADGGADPPHRLQRVLQRAARLPHDHRHAA